MNASIISSYLEKTNSYSADSKNEDKKSETKEDFYISPEAKK